MCSQQKPVQRSSGGMGNSSKCTQRKTTLRKELKTNSIQQSHSLVKQRLCPAFLRNFKSVALA